MTDEHIYINNNNTIEYIHRRPVQHPPRYPSPLPGFYSPVSSPINHNNHKISSPIPNSPLCINDIHRKYINLDTISASNSICNGEYKLLKENNMKLECEVADLTQRLKNASVEIHSLRKEIGKSAHVIKDLSYYKEFYNDLQNKREVQSVRMESKENQYIIHGKQQRNQQPQSQYCPRGGDLKYENIKKFDECYYIQEINRQRRQIHSMRCELNRYKDANNRHNTDTNTSKIASVMQIEEYLKEIESVKKELTHEKKNAELLVEHNKQMQNEVAKARDSEMKTQRLCEELLTKIDTINIKVKK